jgi:hypothetical protein
LTGSEVAALPVTMRLENHGTNPVDIYFRSGPSDVPGVDGPDVPDYRLQQLKDGSWCDTFEACGTDGTRWIMLEAAEYGVEERAINPGDLVEFEVLLERWRFCPERPVRIVIDTMMAHDWKTREQVASTPVSWE